MSEKNAPYLVYTDDEDFILNKEDINSGGGSGDGNVIVIEGIVTDVSLEMQASYNDLYEYFSNGKICVLHFANEQYAMYGMMFISGINQSESYRAYVLWPFTGGTTQNAEFEADSATGNLVFTMGS